MITCIKNKSFQHILFFDGKCGLCNPVVKFLLTHDTAKCLLAVSLHSTTAEHILSQLPMNINYQNLKTVILLKSFHNKPRVYSKSTAVLHSLIVLGHKFYIAYLGFMIPQFFRDRIYDWVAINRYRWFGTHDTCPLKNSIVSTRVIT